MYDFVQDFVLFHFSFMIILFSGSRHYIRGSENIVNKILDEYNPRTDTIVHGGASGVDTTVGKLAKVRGFKVIVVKADWKTHGIKAGPLRNQEMIDKYSPDIAYFLPFPSLQDSIGTRDAFTRAKAKNIKCIVHELKSSIID